MNKVKVLYDLFRTVKGKETFKGELKLSAEKDGNSVLDVTKHFHFDLSKGNGKVKLAAEIDCCGNKLKHDSSTEFSLKNCCGNQDILKKICESHKDKHCCGIKGHINKITFFLSLLNKIDLVEKEDAAELTLDLKDLCKEACLEGCCDGKIDCSCGCDCCKEFLNCDYDSAVLRVIVNKNNEIEKIEVDAKSSNKKVNALLSLNW